MEATWRWVLLTAIAPVAWGSTYYVTRQFLPVDHPLYGAALRALPAGLLLAVCRSLPRGSWWWKSLVLGALNMSAFFVLIYVAAQLLPTSVASVIMATSSVAMAMSSLGYVLAKRWGGQVPVLASTSWQLIAGGLVLLVLAVAVEGAPPALDSVEIAAFACVSGVATAVAFAAWFTGLRHLQAGSVGLIGLLNPVTGVLLGTVLAAETLSAQQVGGLVLVLSGILLGQPAVWRRIRRPPRHRPSNARGGTPLQGRERRGGQRRSPAAYHAVRCTGRTRGSGLG